MENRTILVEQKIKNIQSDFGSVDFDAVKKFHNQLIPKLIDNARAFGASNLPQNNEYEQMLISRYNSLYTELISDELTMAEEVRTCFNQTREDYFNTSEGHINYEITRIKQEYEKAKMLHGRLLGETNGTPFLMKRPWIIYAVLGLLGILEVPLNNSVFAPLAVGAAGTVMLAILLVVITPLLAHFAGKFIKQSREKVSNLLLGIGVVLLLLILTIFLSLLRHLFFEAKAVEVDFNTFQEAYSKMQATLTFKSVMGSAIFWTSFLLNFGLVAVGFVLSYLTHDSIAAFERSYSDFTFRRANLIKKLSDLRRNQYRNFTIQGSGTYTREQKLLDKMTEFRRMHDTLSIHVINLGEFVDGLCKEAINEFRMHNQLARRDIETVPRHWHDQWHDFVAVKSKQIKPLFVEVYPELDANPQIIN
jgi:hypothetical protein